MPWTPPVFRYSVYLFYTCKVNGTVYEEDGLKRPYWIYDKDTDPRYNFSDAASYNPYYFQPRKGKELSEMELAIEPSLFTYISNRNAVKFLVIDYDASYNLDEDTHIETHIPILGWVDSIEPLSVRVNTNSSDDKHRPNTLIRWHPDYLLSMNYFKYCNKADKDRFPLYKDFGFGYGRLLRGPEQYKRPLGVEPRLWIADGKLDLNTEQWCIISILTNYTDPAGTGIVYYYFKIGGGKPTIGQETGQYNQPDWWMVTSGLVAGKIAADTKNITGAWISPFMPFTESVSAIVNMDNVSMYTSSVFNQLEGYSVVDKTASPVSRYVTDDITKYMFVDPTGAVMYTTPWGVDFCAVRMFIDISATEANLCMYLLQNEPGNEDGEPSGLCEGRYFTFPLPTVSVNDNAWSSYVYSGQRDYDIQAKKLQRDEAAASGIANLGTSALGGGIGGAMAAGKTGAGIGSVAGLAAGAVGVAANYYIGGSFDSRNQRITDRLISNQSSAPIIAGNSRIGLEPPVGGYGGCTWKMVRMKPDNASLLEITNEIEELGYPTGVFLRDCTPVIEAGGPMKIEGLRVTGGLPKEAKRQIQELFERGVNLNIFS